MGTNSVCRQHCRGAQGRGGETRWGRAEPVESVFINESQLWAMGHPTGPWGHCMTHFRIAHKR